MYTYAGEKVIYLQGVWHPYKLCHANTHLTENYMIQYQQCHKNECNNWSVKILDMQICSSLVSDLVDACFLFNEP